MANKHVISAAVAALLVLGTAMPGAAAAENSSERTSTVDWSVSYVNYDAKGNASAVRQKDMSSKVSIHLDTGQVEGGPATFTATMALEDPGAYVDTIRWYVNGKCEMTSTMRSGGTVVSKFKWDPDGPTTVYATFSGRMSASGPEEAAFGTFNEVRTQRVTVCGDSDSVKPGSQWSWSKETDGKNIPFTSRVDGEYTVEATAADGTVSTGRVTLKAGAQSMITFAPDGSAKFGSVETKKQTGAANEETPNLVLTLDKALVAVRTQPMAVTCKAGERVFFSVEADGNGLPLSYQWYVGTTGDDLKTKVTGATEPTLTLGPPTGKENGRFYTCEITNGSDTVRTKPVVLTVYGAPKEKPIISITQGDYTVNAGADRWVSKRATVSIASQGGLNGAGNLVLKYSLDNGQTWVDKVEEGKQFPIDVAASGPLTIKAVAYNDAAPGFQTETSTEVNLDLEGPQFEVTGNPTDWMGAPVKLTIKASDSGSGLHTFAPYSWDGGYSWTKESTMPFDRNRAVYIRVRDALGNETAQTINITKVDNAFPKVKVTGNPTSWTKEAITLTAVATDDVGLAEVPYSWDGGKTWVKESTFQVKENKTIQLVVRDLAGNKTTTDIVVDKVDMKAPVVKVTGNPESWSTGVATLNVAAEDGESGLHFSAYSWDGGKTWSSRATKDVAENGMVNLVVRDTAGNQTPVNINVSKLDNGMPAEFTIGGVPSGWTNQDVVLQLTGAKDGESGLAAAPYNWNNEGWTNKNSYTVKNPGQITVQVQDKAGNIRTQTVTIDKMDRLSPVVSRIEGVPETWQGNPATVTVHAADSESGLAPAPYSFDDGKTWQASPTYVFFDNQAVGLKVKDAAGNETYHPFLVKNVDATAPNITVSYLSASDDRTKVVVGLFGSDNASSNLLYCFNYQEAYEELNVWSTNNQQACETNKTITVACKDEMGNIGTRDITPTLYAIGGAEMPLFINNVLSVNGYTLGSMDGAGRGVYLDRAGLEHEYQTHRVGGETIHGLVVEVKAAPMGGGYLSGYARLNGVEFPIYWDAAGTQQMTQEAATGRFYIDPLKLRSSAKTASLQVVLEEYETELKEKLLNSDQISCGMMVDVNPPIVTMSLDKVSRTLTIEAKDALSGMKLLQYQMTDSNGAGEWMNYTGPIQLAGSSTVKVIATDKAGNTSVTDSEELTVAKDFEGSKANDGSVYYYRTDLFDHYLYGTGKKNIGGSRRAP